MIILGSSLDALKKYYDTFITSRLYFWRKSEPAKPTVTIKGETWSPEPLGLEDTLRLLIVLGPSIGLIEEVWSSFQRALKTTDGSRPKLLQAIMVSLADRIEPAVITQVFVILLGKEPEWFRGVAAAELVSALPVLEEVHGLWDIVEAAKKLGVAVRYDKAG